MPPPQEAEASQAGGYFSTRLQDRKPENLACGDPVRAYHAKFSIGVGRVVWQGHAVPVSVDIDAGGRRVSGRKYAALFSAGQLVGVVDYPGQVNAQGTMASYWVGDASAKVGISRRHPSARSGRCPPPPCRAPGLNCIRRRQQSRFAGMSPGAACRSEIGHRGLLGNRQIPRRRGVRL